MAKNIVLLSDGTGNSAGKLSKTNVWRLYQALDLSGPSDDPELREQIAYYDDGVGSSCFMPLAVVGGAFGWGLKRNVIDLYTFLCWNYEEGDQIYCLGFSRGAFTIRVLTGLIHFNGLVGADEHGGSQVKLEALANAAFNNFRINCMIKRFNFMKVERSESQPRIKPPTIAFLGLWDTVAAYGLPIDELTRFWDFFFPLSISNRNLVENVERACHALALDDERNTFHPVLWNEQNEEDKKKITQVWFSGMHSNVGGGYPDDAMSYVSLDWMMKQVEAKNGGDGLRFKALERDEIKKKAANYNGKMEDSRRGFNKTYRYQPRKLKKLTEDTKNQVFIECPKIHESVFKRIVNGADGYAPIGLPSRYAVARADDGDQQQPLGEHETQAEDRSNRQEEVWDLVWKRRVVYFSAVILAGLLAAFPLLADRLSNLGAQTVCERSVCVTFSSIITEMRDFIVNIIVGLIRILLPNFNAINHWLSTYQSHPGSFLVLMMLLIFFIWRGYRLKGKIFDKMHSIWKPFRESNGRPTVINEKSVEWKSAIYKLRTHWLYQFLFKVMKRYVLPCVFSLAIGVGAYFASLKIFELNNFIPRWLVVAVVAAAVLRFLINFGVFRVNYRIEKNWRLRLSARPLVNTAAVGVGAYFTILIFNPFSPDELPIVGWVVAAVAVIAVCNFLYHRSKNNPRGRQQAPGGADPKETMPRIPGAGPEAAIQPAQRQRAPEMAADGMASPTMRTMVDR